MRGLFEYVNPPRIYFGDGSVAELDGELGRAGHSRIHIVTTRSLVASPTLIVLSEGSEAIAAARGTASVVAGHVPLSAVRQIALDALAANADAIVAIGGGSPIDAAKLGALAAGSLSGSSFSLHQVRSAIVDPLSRSALTLFHIPTTLSAAELYGDGGFTDPGSGYKVGVHNPAMTAQAAIYDSRAAAGTPNQLWVSTGIRALDHAVETFVHPEVDPISAELVTSAARDLLRLLPRFTGKALHADRRLEAFLAAWRSYPSPSLASAGLSHVIGRMVGAKNGIPHGITSCVVLPQVIRHHYATNSATRGRIRQLEQEIGLTRTGTTLSDAVQEVVRKAGLPTHFSRSQLSQDAERDAIVRTSAESGVSLETVAAILASTIG